MSADDMLRWVQALEQQNTRLRHLLDPHGPTPGRRHRNHNTLAMVRDVVRRSAETSGSVEEYAAHLEGRLDVVFRVRTTISNHLLAGVSLHTLLADELTVHAISGPERLSINGPDIVLQPPAAGVFALAFHELATNAIKFGALGVPEGRLAVTWSVEPEDDGEPWLTLRWVESGVSVLTSPTRRGFGAEVIEHAGPYQLGGRGALDFTTAGLRCTIRVPMTPALGCLREADELDAVDDKAASDGR